MTTWPEAFETVGCIFGFAVLAWVMLGCPWPTDYRREDDGFCQGDDPEDE